LDNFGYGEDFLYTIPQVHYLKEIMSRKVKQVLPGVRRKRA
jgi:hypothetical protein